MAANSARQGKAIARTILYEPGAECCMVTRFKKGICRESAAVAGVSKRDTHDDQHHCEPNTYDRLITRVRHESIAEETVGGAQMVLALKVDWPVRIVNPSPLSHHMALRSIRI
jgi:hypothetical protein